MITFQKENPLEFAALSGFPGYTWQYQTMSALREELRPQTVPTVIYVAGEMLVNYLAEVPNMAVAHS